MTPHVHRPYRPPDQFALPGLPEAIAVAPDLDHVGVAQQLVEHGDRAKQPAKLGKAPSYLQHWVVTLEQCVGHNKAAVALANKMARIAWAVWKRQATYVAQPV